WANVDTLQISVIGHGRYPIFNNVDISRTVGWLIVSVPMILSVESERPFVEVASSIKAQYRSVPLQGIGHGLLELFSPYAAQITAIQALHPVEVQFNYSGQSLSAQPSASSWLRRPSDEQIVYTDGMKI